MYKDRYRGVSFSSKMHTHKANISTLCTLLIQSILRAPAESQSSLKKTGSESHSTRYVSRMLAQIPRDDNSNVSIVCAGEKGKGKTQECSCHFERRSSLDDTQKLYVRSTISSVRKGVGRIHVKWKAANLKSLAYIRCISHSRGITFWQSA